MGQSENKRQTSAKEEGETGQEGIPECFIRRVSVRCWCLCSLFSTRKRRVRTPSRQAFLYTCVGGRATGKGREKKTGTKAQKRRLRMEEVDGGGGGDGECEGGTSRRDRERKMTIIVILIICKGIVDFHAGQVWPQWRYIMTKTRRVGCVPFARQKARR